MQGDDSLSITDTATVTVEDPFCGGFGFDICDSGNPDTIDGFTAGLLIASDEDSFGGIFVDLVETGDDTRIFTGNFSLKDDGGPSDDINDILEVNPGDVISVFDVVGLGVSNGLILPNPDLTTGAINAASDVGPVSGTVTATYDGSMASIDVQDPAGIPGRGGGGAVQPVVVVDTPPGGSGGSSDLTGSGCEGDCNPPTLGIDENLKRAVYKGFSYNNNPVDVELFYTPYPLITANVGVENLVVLKIYDDGGTQNIAHVGLGFGLGKGESFNDSKATINLDIERDGTQTTTLYDPENALENVRIVTAKEPCSPLSKIQCLVVSIYHTFREPLNFNMVATYVWDFYRNSWQNYYNHGIEIVGDYESSKNQDDSIWNKRDERYL